ncbi:Flagellar basal-body rod protein FlgG [Candidatus Arcanobacter lacustris]|jgi:flagellar basal-body rod protein FlgG|uniref:Flagellar basal-body rod protein FlgG n=1 Tax=Candidatus Arcanibacter lacustris TaxID=1607817 RepID=A0A0F5MQ69_9RICK|nr:Flagellar basal-body rod protein FlgG [Candidatus Arcanobacter lacustris]
MVDRALGIATTGMMARETDIAVISHNLANISTNGFKKQVAQFQDLPYQLISRASNNGSVSTAGLSIGLGTELSGTYSLNTPGDLLTTYGELDFAIDGTESSRGYFKIDMPDGTIAYTRDGNFNKNANGEIVTKAGYTVAPGISVPQGASIKVDEFGNIYATLPGNNGAQNQIGTFDIADFPNTSGLQPVGGNLFIQTPSSGDVIIGTAGTNGLGKVAQGKLEASNVVPVNELTDLITAQRGYELCSNIIKASDEMLQTVNRMKS